MAKLKINQMEGKLWFTGCSHFNHGNIIDLANRPFNSVEDMNQTMIDRWNSKVRKGDTIVHLGDFGFGSSHDLLVIRDKLNGKLVHVHGNHDKNIPWKTVDYLEMTDAGVQLVLFHYPIQEWAGWHRGSIHLHAHTHDSRKTTGKNRVNVAVEAWNYTPVSLADVLEEAKG